MKVKVGGNILYTTFLIIIEVMCMLETSALPDFGNSIVQRTMLFLALILAIFYMALRHYSKNQLLIVIFANTIGLLCYNSSGYTGLLITLLAITLMQKNSIDKNLRVIFLVEIILFFIIILTSQIGIIENITARINKYSYTACTQALGFGHSNTFAAQATSLLFLFLCINRNSLNNIKLIFSLFVIMIIFLISGGRTAFILSLLGVFLISLRDKKIIQKVIFKILPFAQMIIWGILTICLLIIISLGYENTLSGFINDNIFNGRIGLSLTALNVYPITLFGKPLDMTIWSESQFFSLDNGQIMLILNYGLIGTLFYFFLIQKILSNIKKGNEYIFAIIMIIFLIWTLLEGTMYFIGKNFALLFIGEIEVEDIKNKKWGSAVYDT